MEFDRRPGWRQLKKKVVEGMKKKKELEEKKQTSSCGHLFVLVGYCDGRIASSLYKIEVPKLVPHSHSYSNSSSPPSKKKDDDDKEANQYCNVSEEPEKCLEPIIDFNYPAYPREMCCVELNSKLYFIGGHFRETLDRYNLDADCDFPIDVHVLDTTAQEAEKMETTPATPMNAGKPFPYAFTVNGCIFVYDNSMPYLRNRRSRPKSSIFEMYQPRTDEWQQLPDPPFRSVVCGHAIFQEKLLFLSCQGDLGGYVLCFNLDELNWLNNFLNGFSDGHMFYGEAHFLNDTLYGVSGESESVPAAYPGLSPSYVHLHASSNLISDDDSTDWPFHVVNCNTELFDDIAFVGASLRGVHNHSMPNWLSANLLYLGNRRFCYIRCGPFPDDDPPQYEGMILDYFAPYPGTVTDFVPGGRFQYFEGELLHSSHLKIKTVHPKYSGCLKSCFFVSNKTPRNTNAAASCILRSLQKTPSNANTPASSIRKSVTIQK